MKRALVKAKPLSSLYALFASIRGKTQSLQAKYKNFVAVIGIRTDAYEALTGLAYVNITSILLTWS